jgi:hypothetical protein
MCVTIRDLIAANLQLSRTGVGLEGRSPAPVVGLEEVIQGAKCPERGPQKGTCVSSTARELLLILPLSLTSSSGKAPKGSPRAGT